MMDKGCLLFGLVLLSLCSCEGIEVIHEDNDRYAGEVHHDMMVLGERLDDPYSVSNIEAALTKAYPSKAGRVVIKATDLYVRFLPGTDEEYEALVSSGLNLFDHPLDYEILCDGDYYHDPSLDEDAITWQYAVVSPDFKFPPHIRYEVLDECYIPASDAATRAADGIDWSCVEREAYVLTGNENLLTPDLKGESSSRAPKGRITVLDESHGEVREEGLAGVKVSCNSFVKFSSTYTDDQGNYEMGRSFSSDVRYRIVFQNEKGFAIGLNRILVPASASTLGKNGPEGVSVAIDRTSDRRMFLRCVVNNAAYEFYEKCNEEGKNLILPPANTRFWVIQAIDAGCTPMFQHGVMIDDTFVGKFLGDYTELVKMFLPDVLLGVKDLDEYSSVYAQTVHELAHAVHFSKAGKEYWRKYTEYIMRSFVSTGGVMYGNGDGEYAGFCEVGEMWAYYLQNRFYKERYGEDMATFGTAYWFRPHILLYLDERGLGRSEIMEALDSGTDSRETLRSRLENLYPEYNTVIHQAFERY